MADVIVIRQLRSSNGSDRAQRETLRTLGLRGIGSTSQRKSPVGVTSMLDAVSISAGPGNHSCALVGSDTVECWGYNVFGQLGTGSTSTRSTTPVLVVSLP